MRDRWRSHFHLLCGLAFVGCGGPIVMIPGGALSGTPTEAPLDWGFTQSVDTIQVETNAADPYSVNVWGTGLGSRLYVACGDPTSRWCVNLREDPNVKVRIGEALYALYAEQVEDPEELEAVLAAMAEKYDFQPTEEQRAEAQLFGLERGPH